jgi:hypothetical protein
VRDVKNDKLKGMITKYAKHIPKTKKADENSTVIKTASPYLSSNAGDTNRQNWYKSTGKPKVMPPNNATLSFIVNMLVIFRTCRFKSISSDSVGIISQCMIVSENL